MGVVARWGVCVAICAAVVFTLLNAQSPAAAQSALLDTLSTHVTLARAGVVDEVTNERVIRSGDTVATDRTGHAVVTYPDGSTALLEENSELTIEFVRTSAGDYVVRMQQTLGRVWYAITRTVASGGRYEVHSAAMASVIRAGSGSFVEVLPGGETTVVATAGSVETSAGGTNVIVPAGASMVVSAAGTPSPPGPAAAAVPPPTPSPTPPSMLGTPRPPVETPVASPTATTRAPTPSATPTSAFEPPVSTLPPLPVVTTVAKVTKTAEPPATPTSKTSPTTSTRSVDPTPKATATARTTSTPKASQSVSTASVKLVSSISPAVEPKLVAKPAPAPEPVTAAPKKEAKAPKG